MSLRVGEQFFIDSVRNGLKALPEDKQERFRKEVQGFVGQEATHRRLHSLFNGHLEKQGLVNEWAPRAQQRLKMLESADYRHWSRSPPPTNISPRSWPTGCCATTMYWATNRLKTMWLWNSAEESEHKSTAFDMYQALGGDHEWRVTWMRRITTIFLGDTIRQTIDNLRRDGTLWKWSTWKSAAHFLFGKRGLVRETYGPWREYFRKDFHPAQQDSSLSSRWLADSAEKYTPVGA